MTIKNTLYTVTPPDLRLNAYGPSVLLLGVDLEHSKPYTDLYDQLFPEVEITFFVRDSEFTPDLAPWYRAVTGMASSIFVDLDHANVEEVFLATHAANENKSLVFWISQEKLQPALSSLVGSYQYQIFAKVDDVGKFLLDEYDKD
jgi:hypothetical protein